MLKKRGMTFIVAFGTKILGALNSTGGGIMANKPTPEVHPQKSGFNKASLRETHG